MRFPRLAHLTTHIQDAHDKWRPHKCGMCNFKAATEEQLAVHQKMTHENPELMDVAAKAVLDQLMVQEKAKRPAREDTKMINKRDGDKTYADRRHKRLMMMKRRNAQVRYITGKGINGQRPKN